jgi:hypothetical protein
MSTNKYKREKGRTVIWGYRKGKVSRRETVFPLMASKVDTSYWQQ